MIVRHYYRGRRDFTAHTPGTPWAVYVLAAIWLVLLVTDWDQTIGVWIIERVWP